MEILGIYLSGKGADLMQVSFKKMVTPWRVTLEILGIYLSGKGEDLMQVS